MKGLEVVESPDNLLFTLSNGTTLYLFRKSIEGGPLACVINIGLKMSQKFLYFKVLFFFPILWNIECLADFVAPNDPVCVKKMTCTKSRCGQPYDPTLDRPGVNGNSSKKLDSFNIDNTFSPYIKTVLLC